jgi:diacylglycerol O-acyltransferase / wax synthase
MLYPSWGFEDETLDNGVTLDKSVPTTFQFEDDTVNTYRLSGFDASLLHLETVSQPLTGCGLYELDTSTMPGGYSFEAFRHKLAERIVGLPEFRMKLADSMLNLDTPVWVDDPSFDLDLHLHRITLPAPGTRRELSELAGHLVAGRLDRSRPLWDMWVIEGLSEGEPSFRGHVALILRLHHVLGDGVTAYDMFSRLSSAEADPPRPEAAEGAGTIGKRQLVLDGLTRFLRRAWYIASTLLPGTAAAAVKAVARWVRSPTIARPVRAPRTPFAGRFTGRRSFAFVQLDLADVKSIKNRFGTTINDVMLTLVAGALRDYLLDRAALPSAPLVAMMGMPGSEHTRAGRNNISLTLPSLRTDIADPVARLKAIAAANSVVQQESSGTGLNLMEGWMQSTPGLIALGTRPYQWLGLSDRWPMYNLTFANMRGPDQAYYLMGAKVTARYGLGQILYGSALAVIVMSLNGHFDIGFVSCSDLLPDLWQLADALPDGLKELLVAATGSAADVG